VAFSAGGPAEEERLSFPTVTRCLRPPGDCRAIAIYVFALVQRRRGIAQTGERAQLGDLMSQLLNFSEQSRAVALGCGRPSPPQARSTLVKSGKAQDQHISSPYR